jgi:Sulfotransferase domain
VAQSLRVRAEREQEAVRRRLHISRKLLYWHWRIISLERGFSLWEAYLTQARHHVRALQHQACELKYEDVLADPAPALQSLVAFCGLQTTEEQIACVARHTRPERAYAYRDSPELLRFAARLAPRLHALGYAALGPTDSGRRHVPGRDGARTAVGR